MTDAGGLDNTRVFTVPGDYFMMGDNRDNSNDSRTASVGLVHSDLIGKASSCSSATTARHGCGRSGNGLSHPYGRIGDRMS